MEQGEELEQDEELEQGDEKEQGEEWDWLRISWDEVWDWLRMSRVGRGVLLFLATSNGVWRDRVCCMQTGWDGKKTREYELHIPSIKNP